MRMRGYIRDLVLREGRMVVFKIARARERRTRDIGSVRCIKDGGEGS